MNFVTIIHATLGKAKVPTVVLGAATVPENSPVNTVVGTLSVSNGPVGTSYSYSLISNPGNRFNISGSTLRSSAVLDFETAASHTVTIRATGSDASVIDQAFVITVTDIASSPIVITFPTPVEVADDALAGEVVTTFSATSADASDTFVFSLVAASPNFEVVGNQLRVKLGASLVEGASHALTIRATAPNGDFADTPLTVAVVAGGVDVADVFATALYTGNGATQTITNGLDLAGKGGAVWIKRRNASASHALFDTERGANSRLSSDSTGAAVTASNLTAFSSSGFVLAQGFPETNDTISDTYASWSFCRSPKFFDIVEWTGTAGFQWVAHNLTVPPGMALVKRLDAPSDWVAVHLGPVPSLSPSYVAGRDGAWLNRSDAAAYQYGTGDPSTKVGFGYAHAIFINSDWHSVNALGGRYVAILFAHDPSDTGIIQCGGFTTNGGGYATVTLGWRAQYLLAKNVSSAVNSDWWIVDTSRGWGTLNSALKANQSSVEYNPGGSPPFLGGPTDTGFTFREWNGNTDHIFCAIRAPS